jgi:hypothetical protein
LRARYGNGPDTPNYVGQGYPKSYFGIWDNPAERIVEVIEMALAEKDPDMPLLEVSNRLVDGTPIAPYAASAPRQFAKELNVADILPKEYANYTDILNAGNVTATIWQWCVTGKARAAIGDGEGKFGRSAVDIILEQPRRRRYGWIGCKEEDLAEGEKVRGVGWGEEGREGGEGWGGGSEASAAGTTASPSQSFHLVASLVCAPPLTHPPN